MADKSIKIGQRVEIPSKETKGLVAYVGNTHFSSGKWIGVILDEKKGKNNGTVQGKSYFQCEEGFGAFVRQSQVSALESEDNEEEVNSDNAKSAQAERPKSSVKRKIEPTSLRRKPVGNQVPQKPDRLRLPLGSVGKLGTPQRVGKEDKSPGRDSPRQEMKKAQSFVEGTAVRSGSRQTGEVHHKETSPTKGEPQTNFVETLTTQFTPGPSSAAMQTLEEKANALQVQQDMENLKAEITDLNEKLETLKIKRAQDKEKLKEGEKLKLQVEQLIEFKSRIMDSQAALQKDLQKARQEAREAIEARDRHIEETEELMESVEMLTLDKEMAEEKAEALQIEIEQLKEKVEELTLDLEIIKTESAGGEEGVVQMDDKPSSIQVKQLEQQNIRLRETLVRMRDISAHDKHELQKAQKELEGKKSEALELNSSKEKYSAMVSELESTLSDLQEQVDAALGAEEMCETLTDRNLNLEERVGELLETVADLEAINDMNDQLQENSRELELELREELDMANAKIREVIKEREAANEVIVDQDSTIKKFRELVQKMHDENMNLRHSLEKETNKPLTTPSDIIDFKKIFTETKAHSKAIDLELRLLEVNQANQHVKYLSQYLPDTFMNRGGDHDAVLVLLLLPRMIWKADIVIGGLKDQSSPPENIDRVTVLKSHVVEQSSFSSRMLLNLYMLQAMLRQYLHILSSCNVDLFLKMGTMYPEMAAHEKNLDYYIELLKKDQLDETVLIDGIEKAVAYFQTVQPTYLSQEKLDHSAYLCDVSKALNSASQAIKTEAGRIAALLPPSEVNNSDVGDLLKYITTSSVEISNFIKRIKRRLPQNGSAGPISYPKNIEDALTLTMISLYNVARCLRNVSKMSMQQTSLIGDSEGGIPSDKLRELIHQATDLIYASEDQGPDSITNALTVSQETIGMVTDTLEKGEFDFDGTSEKQAIPPISLRAECIKNELKDTEHLKYKLETKEQDLKDLKVALKQKNEELSQMTVRRDMAEKKLSTATKDADLTIEKLQRKLDDTLMMLRRKEKEYNETIEQQQADIESLLSEKGELREKIRALSKRSLYDSISRSSSVTPGIGSPSSPTTSNPGVSLTSMPTNAPSGMMVKDSPYLLQQINNLKVALDHALSSNHLLLNSDMQKKLSALKPLKFTFAGSGTQGEEEKRDLNKDERAEELAHKESQEKLCLLMKDITALRKELHSVLIGVDIVDLTKRKPNSTPVTQSTAPINHLVNYKIKVETLKKRINETQDKINNLIATRKLGGRINTKFSSFPTPQLVKAVAEKEAIKIGRIIIGEKGSATKEEVIPVVLQPAHLKEIHKRILC